MRAISPIFLVVLLAACGPTTPTDDRNGGTDGGSKTDGGGTTTDGGGGTDAGSTVECQGEETQDCPGVSDGNCAPGTRRCSEGRWQPCEGRRQPAPAACDYPNCAGGENPGCACRVGASQDCYDGDANKLGKGPCVKGHKFCVPKAGGSEWGPCLGQVLPDVEDCSGRNLDCTFDDVSCACTANATRKCGGPATGTCNPGTQKCVSGTWGACETDAAGAVAQPKPGDCSVASCTGEPNPGCQCVIGQIEACYTGVFGTEHLGTCAAGTRTCGTSGEWGPCVGQTRPNPICDADFGPSCTGEYAPGCQ
jgi:hypothetical protein